MHNPKPVQQTTWSNPTLPPGHPMQAKLANWVELRDQLADLAAKLEYLNLMVRLERRRS